MRLEVTERYWDVAFRILERDYGVRKVATGVMSNMCAMDLYARDEKSFHRPPGPTTSALPSIRIRMIGNSA